MGRRLVLAFALAAGLAGCAEAPLPTGDAVEGGASVALLNAGGQSEAYTGVGRFRASSNCTAVLVRAPGVPRTAPAHVLTNGHCVGSLGSQEVVIGEPSSATVTFHWFADTPAAWLEVKVTRVAHATMKGADLAVLELDATVAELEARGVRAWTLTGAPPEPGAAVVVVGAPLGFPEGPYLRLAACRLGARAPLVVERQWHWFDLSRADCADIRGGSSGSPVLQRDGARLVGLVNTTTLGSEGLADCWLNRPCEVGPDGARSLPGTSYVVPLGDLWRCFDEAGELEPTLAGCPLDAGRGLAVDPGWLGARHPGQPDVLGRPAAREWNVAVASPDWAWYRYKIGPLGRVDCRSDAGYGPALPLVPGATIADPLPEAEGRHALCAVGGLDRDPAGRRQDPRTAALVAVDIDRTPPTLAPRLAVADFGDAWRVSWEYAPPELSGYLVKTGPQAATDCADAAGYAPPRLGFTTLAKAEAPWRVCAIGLDDADNRTPPRVLDLP